MPITRAGREPWLGVYVVVGIPNYYYWNGVYLRLNSGQWSRAPYLDARWTPCPGDELPGNLRSKPSKGNKGKGHGKTKGHDRDGDDEQ